MPFSLFAARCMFVAKQPLEYRTAVIRRIYKARLASHLGLFTIVKGSEIASKFPSILL